MFNKDGIHEMLEDSDFDSIENVSTFLCRLVDSLFGLTKTGKTNSAFTEYINMVNFLFKGHESF